MIFKVGDCLGIMSSVPVENPVHLHLSTSQRPLSHGLMTILVGSAIIIVLQSSWSKLSWKLLVGDHKARVDCPELKLVLLNSSMNVFMPVCISMFGGIYSKTYFNPLTTGGYQHF